MKNFKLFLALGIFLIFCSTSWADIPNLINFQGILDSSGNPLANRTVSVEFKIYDAEDPMANVKWSETQSVTTDAGGIFNVLLGSSNPVPDSVFKDTLRWLGIKVGTDAEMTPRQQIVSNAYGYRVATVDGATGGTIFGNTSIQSNLTVTGRVGIGTTTPAELLHVSGNIFGQYIENQNLGSGNPTGIRISSPDRDWFLLQNLGGTGLGSLTMADGTAGESRFHIDTLGNVGIGTTNPSGIVSDRIALHLAGPSTPAYVLEQTGIPVRKWAIFLSLIDGGLVISDRTSDNHRLYIDADGDVGIGTGSIIPSNILTVKQFSATDPIADAWTTYSSAEYKQGIHELTGEEYADALQKLLATPVVKYRYKGQSFMDKEKIGIVIEEAPEEIVAEGNQKAASLSEYISLLHAGLKAQQARIEVLEEKIKFLTEGEK